jgi:hypothetical protein
MGGAQHERGAARCRTTFAGGIRGGYNHANNIFWNTKASAAIKDLSLHLLSMGQHFLSFLICSMPAGGASI